LVKITNFFLNEEYEIKGNFILGKNSTVCRDSFISAPVIIGNNCVIGPKVRLGPYVSVGNNSILKNCDIENSILMDKCKIDAKISLSGSIISHGCEIKDSLKPKKNQFLLGERSQISL